jgi:mycofactocin glycosyltransferase
VTTRRPPATDDPAGFGDLGRKDRAMRDVSCPERSLVSLPGGFRVALDPGARFVGDDGTVLVGGSPIRLLRLTPPGRALLDRLAAGEPVPASAAAQRLTRRLLDSGLAHPRPPAPASPPDVAVVIPVRNDAGGLAATLAALGPGPAVVVVDDASLEPGLVAGACSPHGPTVLRRAVQGGPGAARNTGWPATAGEFVAFVDANCEPDPGWLDRLLPHFADPQVAAVAPRIVPVDGAATPGWLAAYEAVSSPLDLGGREANVRPRSPTAYVPTAALVVRRSALDAVGGFDEVLAVGEDVDLVWRLVAAGWTVRYEPRATVRHPMRPTGAAWLGQRYRYGTSAAALARRHGSAVAPAVVSPWTAAAWGLVAAGQPVLGAAVACYSIATLVRRLSVPGTARVAATGHLQGGLALARALRRAWPPAAVLLAVASRPSRPAVAATVVVPPLLDWFDRRPRLDPVRFVALRLADDLAYAAGVWAGCRRERSIRALCADLGGARSTGVSQTNEPVAGPIGGLR